MRDRLRFWTHSYIHTFSITAFPALVHSELSWLEGGLDPGQVGYLWATLVTVNDNGQRFGFKKEGKVELQKMVAKRD